MTEGKPMFIIIEGTDNVGKDTQQNLIIERLSERIFHKVHYSALPFKDKDKLIRHSAEMYNQMFEMMENLKDTNINIIFNRSHLGETVYSPLYRGYSGDFVFDIEKKHLSTLKEHIYLITLVNSPETILSRDDGKSFYTDIESIKAEVEGFYMAHVKSEIRHKLLLDVGDMGPEEVSNIIIDFLSESQPAYSEIQHKLELE